LLRKEQAEKNIKAGEAFVAAQIAAGEKIEKTASGLGYIILAPGNAEKMVTRSDNVSINYVGKLIDGSVFDKSEAPVDLPVMAVVPGFSEGLQLVGEGGKVRLYIPGNLGYGDNPPPGSPMKPGSMLVFDVEVVSVKAGQMPQMPQMPQMDQMPQGAPGAHAAPPSPPPNMKPPTLPPEALKNKPMTPPTSKPPAEVPPPPTKEQLENPPKPAE
jgi:hypothetical protein